MLLLLLLGAGDPTPPDPASPAHTYVVAARDRTFVVAQRDRTYTVPARDRTVTL